MATQLPSNANRVFCTCGPSQAPTGGSAVPPVVGTGTSDTGMLVNTGGGSFQVTPTQGPATPGPGSAANGVASNTQFNNPGGNVINQNRPGTIQNISTSGTTTPASTAPSGSTGTTTPSGTAGRDTSASETERSTPSGDRISIFGPGTSLFGAGLSFILDQTGGEVSGGLAIQTLGSLDIAVFLTFGAPAIRPGESRQGGLAIGSDVFVGQIKGTFDVLAGIAENYNAIIGPFSGVGMVNPETRKFIGGTIGVDLIGLATGGKNLGGL